MAEDGKSYCSKQGSKLSIPSSSSRLLGDYFANHHKVATRYISIYKCNLSKVKFLLHGDKRQKTFCLDSDSKQGLGNNALLMLLWF